ncbi:MAG: DUF169 domain-containing protein [Chloroflexi bacterium]|nr:DUF169 domain-containing protein [Chloroflexota bacterium]
MEQKWADLARNLETFLRLRTFPLAWRRLEREEDLEKIRRVRRYQHRYTWCQAVTVARTAGWTVGITAKDENVCRFKNIAGLVPPSVEELSGRAFASYYLKTLEDAKKQAEATVRIPPDGYEAMVIAPLASEKFDPEVVVVYGNAAQMMFLGYALQWTDYERLQFFFVGEGACADSFAQCYISGKPALAIPCYGERRLGHVQDDELVMAVPANMGEKAVEGLRGLAAVNLKYPIPFFGTEADVSATLARAYGPGGIRERGRQPGGVAPNTILCKGEASECEEIL